MQDFTDYMCDKVLFTVMKLQNTHTHVTNNHAATCMNVFDEFGIALLSEINRTKPKVMIIMTYIMLYFNLFCSY